MRNPLFNTALGASVITRQAKPPSTFHGVSSRVFPLRANMYRLRKFCDAYLNVAPGIAHFQPYLPCVFLMVLDYGRMASEVRNMGWVSQREIAFAVPLEWYDPARNMRFRDFAAVCPFIYVDDETSLSTGRQVYGWPKVKVWAGEEVNPWVYDPMSERHLLRLSAMVMPELYQGEQQEPKTLLEVRQDPPASPVFPPDPSRLGNPFSALPSMMAGYLDLMGSWIELMSGAPQLGYAGAPFDPLSRFSHMAEAGVAALGENPVLNNITLKQFRDASSPEDVCFQGLIQSQIKVERFNAFGMLGEASRALGDPTGGFRLLVHRYTAQPILESLGIEIAEEMRFEGGSIAELRPMFPFWVNVDLEYGLGLPICWRTRWSDWERGPASLDGPPAARPIFVPPDPKPIDDEPPHKFNTTLGGALQGAVGPFDFPNVTMRVLPLLADPQRLRDFVAKYLYSEEDGEEQGVEGFHRFEAWGSYVYAVASNYEEMSSATNNIGWWADRELTFFVPVKCFDADGNLLSFGIVPAFPFVNTSTAAITGAEVRGQPTTRAILRSPPDAWMEESGPSESTNQLVLRCETTVVPALHVGQEQQLRVLAEIRLADALPYNDDIRWRMVGERWGRELLEEHRRLVDQKEAALARPLQRGELVSNHFDAAKALTLEILARHEPVNHFSLKQFRDSEDPDLACYQALIRLPRWIDKIYDMREIEDMLHVEIHEYPSMPIVRLLGLVPKWTRMEEGANVDVFQPVRPFWMKLALKEGLGQTLCWRAGSSDWRPDQDPGAPEPPFGYLAPGGKAGVGFGIMDGLGTNADQYGTPMLRQHLIKATDDWRDRVTEREHFTHAEAADVLTHVEPQLLLESILSAEWEHWGAPRWFLKENRGRTGLEIKSDLTMRTDSVGGPRERKRFFKPLVDLGLGWMTSDGSWYSQDARPEWPLPPDTY
jgi:hypothetical protein